VIRRRVAEGAHDDALVEALLEPGASIDGDGAAEGLRQVRGDGRGLRGDLEGQGTKDLVASARDRFVPARDQTEQHVERSG
jgi:hypothetical protein